MKQEFIDWLIQKGISADNAESLWFVSLVLSLLLGTFISYFITQKVLLNIIAHFFKKTKNQWDDLLVEKKVLKPLAQIVPALFLFWATPYVFQSFPFITDIISKFSEVYIIIVVAVIVSLFLNAIKEILRTYEVFKSKPIDSYFQLIKIILYIIVGIFVLSILLDKSPIYFLSAFGAATAIILLVFKDTILGFVASIQISAHDMVRVGDWVQMDKYGADGNVLQITLNTVKIKNWDHTISTIPTYAFVSDSFRNWRGMEESGGRRIKRKIFLKPSSIRYCKEDDIESFKKFSILKSYIEEKQNEISAYNASLGIEKTTILNGRNLTNIGIFRKYTEIYLHQKKEIRKDMTLIVRQLEATEYGVPIEIYCFTNTTAWKEYEGIQSDIFDHLLAAVPQFNLELSQFQHKIIS